MVMYFEKWEEVPQRVRKDASLDAHAVCGGIHQQATEAASALD